MHDDRSQRLFNDLFELNGNAFLTTSNNLKASFVWSYSANGLTVYEVFNSKVVKKSAYSRTNDLDWMRNFDPKNNIEISSCFHLDGDLLYVKILMDGKIELEYFPIDISCMVLQKYKSIFWKRLASDIKIYNLKCVWEKWEGEIGLLQ